MNRDVKIINGEQCLSERGVVLLAWCAWKEEKTKQGKRFMDAYCQLLFERGYGDSGYLNFLELSMIEDKQEAFAWIRRTFTNLKQGDIVHLFGNTIRRV